MFLTNVKLNLESENKLCVTDRRSNVGGGNASISDLLHKGEELQI